jgi:hypothetical protein
LDRGPCFVSLRHGDPGAAASSQPGDPKLNVSQIRSKALLIRPSEQLHVLCQQKSILDKLFCSLRDSRCAIP